MIYVCDGPVGTTWFRIEREVEAEQESVTMEHAVAKHFRRAMDSATASYKPTSTVYIEQNIGLAAHLQKASPLFLTLRENVGTTLVTAMLPPRSEMQGGILAEKQSGFHIIIVGAKNSDPYIDHARAIEILGRHFGLTLDRMDCFPYAG
ncbi:MAG: hypothetical protein VCE74_00705 [Alphaproteobacteria bacterium]